MIEIDGSYGEGGGGLLRVSTALSALTGIPVHVKKIRAHRPQPGLMPQHLQAVKAVSLISQAQVEGLELGSEEITFCPHELNGGKWDLDIKTAGSISLVLQAVMIPAMGAKEAVDVTVYGGTDVRWAPSVDYLKNVTLPLLNLGGYQASIEIKKRGYYPRGGGQTNMLISPLPKPKILKLDKLVVNRIRGVSNATDLPSHVAKRQAEGAEQTLLKAGYQAQIDLEVTGPARGAGSGIVLWSEGEGRVGGSALGERGKRAEKVGEEAAHELLYHIQRGAPLDRYLSDQIIPYLSPGSRVKVAQITPHTRTNIYVKEKIMGERFHIEEKNDGSAVIAVE
ncbi:MAG: RNA 3'-terminal-phosphate cyclase [Methanobacteriales archaeon Met13]